MQRRAARDALSLARGRSGTILSTLCPASSASRFASSDSVTAGNSDSMPSQRTKHTFRVEANYLGANINVYDLVKLEQYKDSFKTVHKGAALISLGDGGGEGSSRTSDMNENDTTKAPNEQEQQITKITKRTTLSQSSIDQPTTNNSFMAVTSYGSAVFFDTPKELKERCLSLLLNKNASVVSEPLKDHTLYKEEFDVTIDPSIGPRWSILENPDCIVLQKMDVMNMQTVAHVLGQSVALEFYGTHVEKTLETFCSLNQEMMESANIGKLNKQMLLQLVAENNIVMSDIISKLGVHERFDVAWREAKYGELWEYLRQELEIDSRFETLDMKLNLVQNNLKYILELHQQRKSVALEWTIIVLIAVEIVLSLFQIGHGGAHG